MNQKSAARNFKNRVDLNADAFFNRFLRFFKKKQSIDKKPVSFLEDKVNELYNKLVQDRMERCPLEETDPFEIEKNLKEIENLLIKYSHTKNRLFPYIIMLNSEKKEENLELILRKIELEVAKLLLYVKQISEFENYTLFNLIVKEFNDFCNLHLIDSKIKIEEDNISFFILNNEKKIIKKIQIEAKNILKLKYGVFFKKSL